jgi:hypothetical protein
MSLMPSSSSQVVVSHVSQHSETTPNINLIRPYPKGISFLPLRQALSGGVKEREGNVFFVFAAIMGVASLYISRLRQ